MADFRHILKGSVYLAVGSQLARVVSFAQLVILTKYLGSADYGAWSLIQAIPAMLLVLTDMGVNSIMLRTIARDKTKERSTLQRVLSLKFILAPVYVLAVYLVSVASGHGQHVVYLTTLYALSIVVGMCGQTLVVVWRAQQRFGLEAKITLAKDVAISLLLIAATLLGWGLEGLIWVSILHGFGVSSLLLWRYLGQQSLSWKWSSPRNYLNDIRVAVPFAVHGMLSPLSATVALVMLGWLSDFSTVGVYNAAFRIVVFLYFVPNALQRTLLPQLSLQHLSSPAEFRDTIGKALRIVLLISIPSAAGLALLAHDVVALLFGVQFEAAGPVLTLLALSVPLYYVRVVVNAGLYASNREKIALLVTAVSVALGALSNWVLIPRIGSTGAAFSTILVEAVLCGVYCGLLARDYTFNGVFRFTTKVVLASSLMALAVWSAEKYHLVLRVLLGAVVYATAAFGTGIANFQVIKRYCFARSQASEVAP